MGDSFNFLHKLLDSGKNMFWTPPISFNEIVRVGDVPDTQCPGRKEIASADSAYVARSYKDTKRDPEVMALSLRLFQDSLL